MGSTLFDGFDPQQRTAAELFCRLVHDKAGKTALLDYVEPNVRIQSLAFIQALAGYLGQRLRFDKAMRVLPGVIQVSTITQDGWTIRVRSTVAKGGSVTLLWDPSIDKGVLSVPSALHLASVCSDEVLGYGMARPLSPTPPPMLGEREMTVLSRAFPPPPALGEGSGVGASGRHNQSGHLILH